MKFIVSSTGLFSRLQAISRVVNSKNSLPILDCFLFDLKENSLHVTASDSETTLTSSFPCFLKFNSNIFSTIVCA